MDHGRPLIARCETVDDSRRPALAEPTDLAALLTSYIRHGLARVEAAGNVPSLVAVCPPIEEALGIRFEGERGGRAESPPC